MDIALKRAYDPPEKTDGYRVLVDRLWPRGVSKEQAKLDEWRKEIAPTDSLRKWFHHDAVRWGEFRRRYLAELKEHRTELRELAARSTRERVTLVYGAKDTERNQAVVLRQYLHMLGGGDTVR